MNRTNKYVEWFRILKKDENFGNICKLKEENLRYPRDKIIGKSKMGSAEPASVRSSFKLHREYPSHFFFTALSLSSLCFFLYQLIRGRISDRLGLNWAHFKTLVAKKSQQKQLMIFYVYKVYIQRYFKNKKFGFCINYNYMSLVYYWYLESGNLLVEYCFKYSCNIP